MTTEMMKEVLEMTIWKIENRKPKTHSINMDKIFGNGGKQVTALSVTEYLKSITIQENDGGQ